MILLAAGSARLYVEFLGVQSHWFRNCENIWVKPEPPASCLCYVMFACLMCAGVLGVSA